MKETGPSCLNFEIVSMSHREVEGPEIFIGFVAPIGGGVSSLVAAFSKALKDVEYECTELHLIEEIHQLEDYSQIAETPIAKRYRSHMDAGNSFRARLGMSAVAGLGVAKIRLIRQERDEQNEAPIPNFAYLFRSLKHPKEVERLREVYGDSFVLAAAYSPPSVRRERLSRQIANSLNKKVSPAHGASADQLIEWDQKEEEVDYGQRVRDAFELADVFFDTSVPNEELNRAVQRFVQLYFGHPYHTPTKDEYGMFLASAAALRSAALGRQVGAAVTKQGSLLALGCNEVPKAHGGLYWSDDEVDHRDFRKGEDSNDRIKHSVFSDVLDRLRKAGWLTHKLRKTELKDLVESAIAEGLTKGAYFGDLIEFGRTVHAEMAAITDSAGRGVAIQDAVLYVTTFPCHECARHIIAAGIKRVVYIEPYPKSLAQELHGDEISVDEAKPNSARVSFEPFVGVAPRLYMQMFRMLGGQARKTADGKVIDWEEQRFRSLPRISLSPIAYVENEADFFRGYIQALETECKYVEEG